MKLKVKDMDISTGSVLVGILNKSDASLHDLHTLDRIKIRKGKVEETIVLDIAESSKAVPKGSIGLFEEALHSLDLKKGDIVEIIPAKRPVSIEYIKKKLDGYKLSEEEINQIVWDIVHNKLSDIELTYFVAACYSHSLDVNETILLTKAMTNQGDLLKLKRYPIMDKHCVGGVAGNRTTPIVVSIIAAAGLTIPKTSSRSITSPAGTADTMEVLADVSFSLKEMKKIVDKTNGCFVWGGALNLAPADDKIIKVEKPLSIDAKSQLLASVMAKKASVSATHLLIDIPAGKGAKIDSMHYATTLKKDFELLAGKLGMKHKVIITDGSQPIGNGIGPALEARDVLHVLRNDSKAAIDLKIKSIELAGLMLELAGKAKKGKGIEMSMEILESGLAYKKFIEIIKAQGGKEIIPSKIKVGKFKFGIKSKKKGKVKVISSEAISKIARVAGAPDNMGAGVYLHKHVGDEVKKGEVILTIYSDTKIKLDFALRTYKTFGGIDIN
jgi:AMP phosphorylase